MRDLLRLVEAPVAPEELVADSPSFEDLFRAESNGLFGALCLVVRNRAEAEDLTQDAFLKVWERWDRVSGLDDPTGYLYRTAFNAARKRFRRAALAMRRATRPEPAGDPMAAADARTTVAAALEMITPRQRMAIVITDLLGYTSEDAAPILGVKAVTVRVLASQARAAMRKTLSEER